MLLYMWSGSRSKKKIMHAVPVISTPRQNLFETIELIEF